MESGVLFPSEYFRALERLSRRPAPHPGGQARSPRPGQGRLGHEHRDYQLGDSPSRVDWRASARQPRLQVRRLERDRGGEVVIWLDRHRSLCPQHARRDQDQRRLALALAWLALESGASVSLAAGAQAPERFHGVGRRARLQHALEALPPPLESDSEVSTRWLDGTGQSRSTWILTDPWSTPELWNSIRNGARGGFEAHVVSLILPEEDEPPSEALQVIPVRDGEVLRADLIGHRARYRRQWQAWLAKWRAAWQSAGHAVFELRCGPPEQPASGILKAAEGAGVV